MQLAKDKKKLQKIWTNQMQSKEWRESREPMQPQADIPSPLRFDLSTE